MKIYENFDLTEYNSYRVKATCKRAIFLYNENEIVDYFLNDKSKKILLGSGHNIILSKVSYEEDFVIFNGNYDHIEIDEFNDLLNAESGATMLEISEKALFSGLSGVEIFYDIPSSLGGAIVMNAGASGEEIKDILVKVRYLDLNDGRVKEINKDEMEFEYRNSFFQKNRDKIVLSGILQLHKKDKAVIEQKMMTIKKARYAKQPKDFPNAGSVFKRPKGFYVGAMIDELNLKGLRVGGAKVSEKHGGFIINYDNASGEDIVNLINIIKERVLRHFNVDLEIEQRII